MSKKGEKYYTATQRQNYRYQLLREWVRTYHPDIYKQIEEVALKAYPRTKESMELPPELRREA